MSRPIDAIRILRHHKHAARVLPLLNRIKPLSQTSESQQLPDTDPLLDRLRKFTLAAEELQNVWDEVDIHNDHPITLCGKYPFAASFDELVTEIEEWYEAARAYSTESTSI